ncbi:transcription factor TFIIE, subunit alpha [Sulfolobus acidocaldarius]|uniref:Transcription factor E n=4 Tax=Sulfolobus acidocaldarius TaxID=2285 RepID=TFE_SULAC|nr:transcription factor TFIIE, subunit alpha [Sulfolobus acidocaldarius]Q4JAZ3.2 RecName: Full=Transcription factor E; Short=TFE; AltName: Full=TFIIE subunit alpha homolog; AltName: Full=Transcription initiation factor TFIIE [Sulfolobus acidocaldarius DSM 639]AAO73479.1 conserved hypothetical protein [Sulfolobus acidocaldarius]AGE70607.1 transcription factor TFIIE, alpha subunit [Sulfolobus acidocaldarius N8]AGE72880.1 transcription factor TFIIE, alpha subunit [Sulfolobus acidocaldarius Ron12/I
MLNLAKELVGDEALGLLKYLIGKKSEITDEEIAKELNTKPNEVRKYLYLLSDHGLVTYRKTKDKDSNLYIYYWKVNVNQINEILLSRKRLILEKLRNRYEQEKDGLFYFCPQDNIKYSFDDAIENEFKCLKCGTSLSQYDSEKARSFLEQKIKQIEEEINKEIRRESSKSY